MRYPKIYLAGPYNGKDVVETIQNMAHGLQLNAKIEMMTPWTYCPWKDFLSALFTPWKSIKDYKEVALNELLQSDALVLGDLNPRWQNSTGTIDELATCVVHDIPIFLESDLEDLDSWLSRWFSGSIYKAGDQEDDGEVG